MKDILSEKSFKEEILLILHSFQASEVSFQFSVADQRDGVVEKWSAEEDMEPFRTVLLLPAYKLMPVIETIKQELAKT